MPAFVLHDQTYAASKAKVKTIKFTNATNYVKTIKKGAMVKLKISVSPSRASKKMKFKSSNKKVATISQKGVIKAKKKGTTYITAYARDGSKKKKRIKVIVGTPVTSIKTSGGNTVVKGNRLDLDAAVYPRSSSHKRIVWRSSDTRIATVNDQGKVTYKRDGKVTITAYARDGSKVKRKVRITSESLRKNDTNYIAHRGLSGHAPENSMTAFKLACQNGFQGVECDIWEVEKEIEMTEGAIETDSNDIKAETDFVVMHDSTLDRMTSQTGSILEKTFEQLSTIKLTSGTEIRKYPNEKIPSLDDFLNVVKKYPATRPIVEVKTSKGHPLTDEGAEKIISKLELYGLSNKTTILSYSEDTLEKIKAHDQDIHTTFLTKSRGELLAAEINWAKANGIEGISSHYNTLSKIEVSMIKNAGLEVGVYTVNKRLTAYEFIHILGVDYLTSNYRFY